MSYAKRILRLLNIEERKKLIFLLFIVFFSMILEVVGVALIVPLLNIILNKELVTDWLSENLTTVFQNYNYSDMVYVLIFIIFIVYLIKNSVSFYFLWLQNKFTNNVQVRMANSLLKQYLLLPYENYLEKKSSILLRNIEEVRTFQGVLLRSTLAISEIIIFCGIISLLLLYNFKITLFIFLFFFTTALIMFKFLTPLVKKLGEARLFHAKRTSLHTLQALSAFKEIRIFGRLDFFFKKFYYHNSKTMLNNLKYNLLDNTPKVVLEMLFITTLLSTIALMVYSNYEFSKIITLLALYSVASFRIMPSINRIIQSIQNLRFMMPVVDMLYNDLIDQHVKINKDYENQNLENKIIFKEKISIKNLSFKYERRTEKTLKNINLEIHKNEIVGIIGESGSGKSTLINLLLGLLKPSEGLIEIDQKDIEKNIQEWRGLIGYVPQSIFITDDTLKNNIAFGIDEKNISNEKLLNCINLSQLDGYVNKQSSGLNTLIGEKGSKISGGELQRLGIARALYNKPKILILDESTNSLDFSTEALLLKEIEKIKKNIKIIIITHR
jgi:ABC-type bacteriocin/lantibiotic exporter with double-glycine peptidase domain